MEKKIIERYWKGGKVACHDKIDQEAYDAIRRDIHDGCVFPAVRENEIHLYYEGGRALRIRPRSVYTHSKYQGGSGDRDTSVCLTQEKYEEIKGKCKGHDHSRPQPNRPKNKYKESWIVSRLFERFSFWSKAADPDQPKLIDIEVRFRSPSKGPKMIDLLFLRPDGHLQFVEVKRQHDPRIRSSKCTPEVTSQIDGYLALVKQANHAVILAAYRCARIALQDALNLKQFREPQSVKPRVPILVCRQDTRTGRDIWLARRLEANATGKVLDNYFVIDGGAIDAGAYDDSDRPPWCASGRWKDMDLRRIFDIVDESATSESQ